MEKKTLVLSWVILLMLCFFSESVYGKINFSANSLSAKISGYSSYHIFLSGYIPGWGLNMKIESELEFPLDVYCTGFTGSLEGKLGEDRAWFLNFNALKNLSDPDGAMKDSDWYGFTGSETVKFSYTESEANLNAEIMDLRGRIGFFLHPEHPIDLVLGYKYEKFTYEIIGVSGWYLDEQGSTQSYDNEYDGVNVLDYLVKYHIPYAGFATNLEIASGVNADVELLYSPLASASDKDDHILRNKFSTAKCSGSAYFANAKLKYTFFSGKKLTCNAALGFEYIKSTLNGEQDQYWYGDDPASYNYDDTGDYFKGIEDKISFLQKRFLLSLGCSF